MKTDYFKKSTDIVAYRYTCLYLPICMSDIALFILMSDMTLAHLNTVILEIFGVNIFVGPPNDEIKNTDFFLIYNEKLYVCVPERRKLDVSKI